jgi:chromosome segregation ATPase
MKNSLKQLKYEIKQQQKIKDSNEKEEKERKSLYQKEIRELENSISSSKSELSEIKEKVKSCQKQLNNYISEAKKLEKKNKELTEENTRLIEYIDDQKRFIKNLEIREQIVSQREERVNKIKLCPDSK